MGKRDKAKEEWKSARAEREAAHDRNRIVSSRRRPAAAQSRPGSRNPIRPTPAPIIGTTMDAVTTTFAQKKIPSIYLSMFLSSVCLCFYIYIIYLFIYRYTRTYNTRICVHHLHVVYIERRVELVSIYFPLISFGPFQHPAAE